MDIVILLAHISSCSPIVPLALSFKVRKPLKEIIYLRYILGGSLLFDAVSLLMAIKGINSYPFTNLFFILQAWILFSIYKHQLATNKKVIETFRLSFAAFFLVNYFFIQTPELLNSYSISISGVLFMSLSLYYFYNLLQKLPEVYIHRMPMVWINIAVLVYYAGNLFLFIFNNYFTEGIDGNQRYMWMLHNILNITKNILFFVAIWQNLRKNISS